MQTFVLDHVNAIRTVLHCLGEHPWKSRLQMQKHALQMFVGTQAVDAKIGAGTRKGTLGERTQLNVVSYPWSLDISAFDAVAVPVCPGGTTRK